MALIERRNGLSTVFRLTLLLILCIVILECGAVSGVNRTREFSSKGKLNEQDPIGQAFVQSRSRSKRSAVEKRVTPKYGQPIPGIPDSKTYVAKNGSFPNGKLCWNGEERFTPAEAEIFRQFSGKDISAGKYIDPLDEGTHARKSEWRELCSTKTCTFDPKSASYICGVNVTEGAFEDGTFCFDGTKPPLYTKKTDYDGREVFQEEVQEKYSKFCKSGKCTNYLVDGLTFPMCGNEKVGSTSLFVQPFRHLLVALLGLSVFFNLQ